MIKVIVFYDVEDVVYVDELCIFDVLIEICLVV